MGAKSRRNQTLYLGNLLSQKDNLTLTAELLPGFLVHLALLLEPGVVDGKLVAHELPDALPEHVLLRTETNGNRGMSRNF